MKLTAAEIERRYSESRINRILADERRRFPRANPIDIDLDVIGWLAEYVA